MKQLMFTVTILFVCVSCLQATDYYVSTTGSNSQSGLSLSQAWGSFKYAVSKLQPGDRLIIANGIYSEALTVSVSGLAGSPIVIKGESRTGVIIQEMSTAITIIDRNYVTIEDMTIRRGRQGVFIKNCRHITLRRVNIFEVVSVGIWFRDKNDEFLVTECQVENMTGSSTDGWGIRVNDDNGGKRGKGVIAWSVFRNGWRSGARLQDTIVDLYYNIFDGWGGDGSRDHGVYYGNGAPEYDAGATTIIEGNIFIGNHGNGLKVSKWYNPVNMIIKNNIFAKNDYDGLVLTWGVDGIQVYNNTFYNNKNNEFRSTPYDVSGGNRNIKVKNNLFYSQTNLILLMANSEQGLEIDYNCYYSTASTKFRTRIGSSYTNYSSLSAWRNNNVAPGIDSHSMFADPLLVNPSQGDYTLQSDSPCIDAGTALPSVIIDFNQVVRPQGAGYDIGAFEYLLIDINPDVMIWLEAESGVLTAPMQIATDMNASENHFIYVPNGSGSNGNGKTEYTINIPKAGNYIIWVRALSSTGSEDSFYLLMDDGRERLWDCLHDGRSSQWKWDQVTERGNGSYNNPQYDPSIFALTEGEHRLIVKEKEGGAKLDLLLLTTDFNYVPVEQSSVNEIGKTVPDQYNLQQNYPNPFNSETVISYQLPRSSHVTLKVFNSLGQKIRTLVTETKPAGTYHVRWDGSDNHGQRVCSGIYYYEMIADNFRTIKKMLHIR